MLKRAKILFRMAKYVRLVDPSTAEVDLEDILVVDELGTEEEEPNLAAQARERTESPAMTNIPSGPVGGEGSSSGNTQYGNSADTTQVGPRSFWGKMTRKNPEVEPVNRVSASSPNSKVTKKKKTQKEPSGLFRYLQEPQAGTSSPSNKKEKVNGKVRHQRAMITAKVTFSGTARIPMADTADYLWPLSPYYPCSITESARGGRTITYPTGEHMFGAIAAYHCRVPSAQTARIYNAQSPALCRNYYQAALAKADSKSVAIFECRGTGYHAVLRACRLKADKDSRVKACLLSTWHQYLAYNCRHGYLGVGSVDLTTLRPTEVPPVSPRANWVGQAWMQVREELRESMGQTLPLSEDQRQQIEQALQEERDSLMDHAAKMRQQKAESKRQAAAIARMKDPRLQAGSSRSNNQNGEETAAANRLLMIRGTEGYVHSDPESPPGLQIVLDPAEMPSITNGMAGVALTHNGEDLGEESEGEGLEEAMEAQEEAQLLGSP